MNATVNSPALHSRMKRADLASGVGAAILGAGVGVLAASYLAAYAGLLVVVGLVLHAWAMLERRRLETAAPTIWWAETLYWLCWLLLLVIGALVLRGA